MPTIAFANSKGGSGKSTAAAVLATQLAKKLAERGAEVSVLDADPNEPISDWAKRSGAEKDENGKFKKPLRIHTQGVKLSVIDEISESTIIDHIDAAAEKNPFVIVDLEGTANMMVAYAISRADLVIIPVQGSQLDAKEAAKTVNLIKQQEKAFGKTIPFAILFTRTNPALKPRTLAHIQDQFVKHRIRAFRTQLHEREAYRALFSFGGTLDGLDPAKVSGLEKAVANAQEYAAEVVAMLRAVPAEAERAGVA